MRGLKLLSLKSLFLIDPVAPYTGAWIEIVASISYSLRVIVAPYTGAWIEIASNRNVSETTASHPTRVRGLKSLIQCLCILTSTVAPYTGAWIEI